MTVQNSEPENEIIDAAHIQARVDDWASRIDDLYRELNAWLPPGYRSEISQGVTMHEELMREFSIGPRKLPVLSVFDGDNWIAKVIPFGLWVIGANGRLDLLVRGKRGIIVGADLDAGKSSWLITLNGDRPTLKDLNQTNWVEALQ